MEAPVETSEEDQRLRFTIEIVTTYVRSQTLPAAALPDFIRDVYRSLKSLRAPADGSATDGPGKDPVRPRRTVFNDHLVCLEDGLRMKMLKRHLQMVHRMSPAEYRAKWGLPSNYPMVAPDYAKVRSALAKRSGLGKRPEDGVRAAFAAGPRKKSTSPTDC
jgi:predicted transcriptional regulator